MSVQIGQKAVQRICLADPADPYLFQMQKGNRMKFDTEVKTNL